MSELVSNPEALDESNDNSITPVTKASPIEASAMGKVFSMSIAASDPADLIPLTA